MTIQRRLLRINGVTREVLCDPQTDSLATVVRRLGLTGTKVGCDIGQCGSCSIIVDGKLVRSCALKMRRIADFAQVETIEGLGTADRLHPLQLAFITYASVQCGFCSPGFIMSAKALLAHTPTPNRQQVRDWFTLHNNICRCTGYKPIVDAVMAAAAVMRGENSMDEILFTQPSNKRLYGSTYPKPNAVSRVTGSCDFGADIAEKMPPNSLHLAPVLAKKHHAKILNIDSSAAMDLCGVEKVITAADVKGSNRLFAPQGNVRYYGNHYDHPVICDHTVRRYGDVVAVVAATSREQARRAAQMVQVEYQDLPPLSTYIEAVQDGAERIHKDTPNIYLEQPLLKGADTSVSLDTAQHMVGASFLSSRQPHLTIEPDVVQAYPQDGGITIQCKTQFLFGTITFIADAIGLSKDKIRILLNPGGASFGYSMSPANYALAAACALAVNQPVSLVLSYEEHQHCTGKRSPAYINARLSCDDSGKFNNMDYHVGMDHGAYSELAGALTSKVCRFFGFPYAIANIRGLVQTAFTNNNFGIAFRAFGSPQSFLASEQLVDMLAQKLDMDPFYLRYKNVAQPGELCTTSVPYRAYPMTKMMDMMRPLYEEAKQRAQENTTAGKKRGVGLSWGGYQVGKSPDHSEVDLELNADNTITYYSTWADVGQGADTGTLTHAHEALRELGIGPEQITFVLNDTARCPDTGSASGSRSHHAAGMATIDAANQLLTAMRKNDGSFRTHQEMVREKIHTRYRGIYDSKWPDVDPDTGHGWGSIDQNFMFFMTEVEVDVATGKTAVLAATIIADVGVVGNYHAVLGQAWGGFSHSVGFALSENYDDVDKHATLFGAGVPQCNDIPDNFTVLFVETARENAPHGSTGCSEGFQSAGHVAILNGIANATGVRITTLPATPEKVKSAIEGKNRGENKAIDKWDLGCELYQRLHSLKNNPKSVKDNQ